MSFALKATRYVDHPKAEMILFWLAALDALFLPFGTEALLIPMVILNSQNAFRYATVAACGAVAGSLGGYILGYILHFAALPFITRYGFLEFYQQAVAWYGQFDTLLVVSLGVTPLPFGIISIFSGFMSAQPAQFLMASLLARLMRYGFIAWILWRGGPRQQEWLERNLFVLSMAGGVAGVMILIFLKYLWLQAN